MFPGVRIPALLTRTSAFPNVSFTDFHSDATDSAFFRSVGTARTLISLLMVSMSFRTASSLSADRATMTMPFGPALANDFAKPFVSQSRASGWEEDTYITTNALTCTGDDNHFTGLTVRGSRWINGWVCISVKCLCELRLLHKVVRIHFPG